MFKRPTHKKADSISMDEPVPKDFQINSSTNKIKFAIENSLSTNAPDKKEKEKGIIKITPTDNTTIGTLSQNQSITLPPDNSTADNHPNTTPDSNHNNLSFCEKYCIVL